jgi:hypothetical protein
MNEDTPAISVVTDISANIFAVFIVILIVLLALPHDEAPPAAPSKPIDVLLDLVSVTKTPLAPGDLVDLLFSRRRAADAIGIDLFDDRIVVTRPGEPPDEFSLPLGDRSDVVTAEIATMPTRPIGLYVFDHRGYATVLKLLGGRPFREMSVPFALRAVVDDRQDWREGFRNLIDRSTDLPSFRSDLSRLLASPDPSLANAPLQPRAGRHRRAPNAETAPPPLDDVSARVRLWLQRVLAVGAILAGVGLIIAVEWRWSRVGRRPSSRLTE